MSYGQITTKYDAALMTRRACYYLRLGFALTPVKYGDKLPAFGKGWNKRENLIQNEEEAQRWFARPFNIGIPLGASGINSLDIDDMELARADFQARGYDLNSVLETHPHTIQGAGLRLWFQAGEDDPITSRRFFAVEGVTAYEIRGGDGFQDVAPGSLHPKGFEYRWAKTPPLSRDDLPVTPEWMYALYEALAQRAEKPSTGGVSTPARNYTGPSVIEAFNARYAVQEVLERNGYKRRGDRYLSPNSKTKLAGVTVYVDGDKCRAVSHHTSDFWNDQHGHDAFDLFTQLEHDGNLTAALEEARRDLGMERGRLSSPPVTQYTDAEVQAAWELHTPSILESIGASLATQMHHRALTAVMDLLAFAYQSVAEGHSVSTPDSWRAVQVGGVKGLAALLGGHPSDLRARLALLSDKGCLRTERVNPADPQSGLQILLPADPLKLPFLQQTQEGSKSVIRPLTREIRKERSFILPPNKEARLRGGRIKKMPSLRALSRVALLLSQHPGLSLANMAERLRMRKDTLRRKVGELAELGYLTEGGSLRCTFAQFFADLRAEGAEKARGRVEKVLSGAKDYFTRRLLLARLGLSGDEEAPSLKRRLARTEQRLVRLADGEMPHMVLGVAS